MKITAAIFSIILGSSNAAIHEAQYGGCLNATKHEETPGRGQSFHCHFSSDSCLDGEDWLTPTDVSLQGFSCTCDDDFNQNVFTTGCYDMFGSHDVLCAASADDCPEFWYVLGNRYGAGAIVADDCGHGSAAYTGDEGSCGKQCLCNFAFKTFADEVEVGDSKYGKCLNTDTNVQYCAATESTCSDGETYFGPHSDTISGPVCNCDRAKTGACMTGDALSYCAVAEDSCDSTMTFVKAAALPADVDCRLCKNTWDAPTVSPAPTEIVTPPPTNAPTVSPTPAPCVDDHVFRHQGKKKKSCKWIGKTANRTKKLCKKTKVEAACNIVCGECCMDDNERTFKAEGGDRNCSWLWNEKRKKEQCPRDNVNYVCAATCGRCCSNDKEFEFDIGTAEEPKVKKCGWFKKKARAKKWCAQEPTIAEACQKSCDTCDDYTVAATDAPVAKPTKSPVKAPVKQPVGGDDD